MHEVPWCIVQRMLIDAPRYDSDGDDEVHEEFETPEDLINAINEMAN